MLPEMRVVRGIGGLRHLLPVALIALAGHLALYGTFSPAGGAHAYFAWYEPVVAGLSVAAIAILAALLLAAATADERLRRRVVPVLLPATRQPLPLGVRATRLALASLAFLVCQETLERSLSEDRLAPGAFAPSQLLLLLGVVAATAALVAFVERSCSDLIALVVRTAALRPRADTGVRVPAARRIAVRRRHPLAELRGLRAPPLPA
jgi:hypothetical protein